MPRNNKIIIRSGTVAPTASDFAVGEPAFDKSAGKLYIKNEAGAMVELGTGGSGGGGGSGSLSGSVTVPGLADPYFSHTSLLLHCNGTGNTFVDSSGTPKTITAVGNVTQSTAQSKWGGKSAYFDGSGDALTFSMPAIGTGDFAIEMWVYLNNTSSEYIGLYDGRNSDVSSHPVIFLSSGVLTYYVVQDGNASGATRITGGSVSTGAWHHIAVARSSGTTRMYFNGTQAGSSWSDSTDYPSSPTAYIGALYNVATLNGYIDDVRVTLSSRGHAGSTITVPTAAFPDSADLTIPVTITGSGGGSGSVDVYEFATPASFPATGTAAALYIDKDRGKVFRWESTVYVELGPVGGSGEDSLLRSLFLPSAPTSVTTTAGNSQVSLSWTAPTVSAQTPITDYLVQSSTNSGSTWTTFSDGTSAATSATVTGLTNGTAYVFRVAAVNGVGTGAYTAATASVTPGNVFRAIPTMTDYTSPSGEVSGEGNQNPIYSLLWQAFDNNSSTYAQFVRAPSNAPQRMIQYAFPDGQKSLISGYTITPFMNFGDPFDQWVVYGSDDLSTWTEIDSRSGLTTGWTSQQARQFNLAQPQNFRAYRWVFQTTTDNSGPNQISTLQLTE